jgi:hypothetical protein
MRRSSSGSLEIVTVSVGAGDDLELPSQAGVEHGSRRAAPSQPRHDGVGVEDCAYHDTFRAASIASSTVAGSRPASATRSRTCVSRRRSSSRASMRPSCCNASHSSRLTRTATGRPRLVSEIGSDPPATSSTKRPSPSPTSSTCDEPPHNRSDDGRSREAASPCTVPGWRAKNHVAAAWRKPFPRRPRTVDPRRAQQLLEPIPRSPEGLRRVPALPSVAVLDLLEHVHVDRCVTSDESTARAGEPRRAPSRRQESCGRLLAERTRQPSKTTSGSRHVGGGRRRSDRVVEGHGRQLVIRVRPRVSPTGHL